MLIRAAKMDIGTSKIRATIRINICCPLDKLPDIYQHKEGQRYPKYLMHIIGSTDSPFGQEVRLA